MKQNQLQLIDDELLLEYFMYSISYFPCKTFIGVDGEKFSATAGEIINEMVRRNLVERMDET
jgi:hypothetical protein